jgi:hypothetical protein
MTQGASKPRAIDEPVPPSAVVAVSMSSVMEVAPAEGLPEFQWHEIPLGAFSDWVRFASYLNDLEARIVAGNLVANGVPSIFEPIGQFPGMTACAIWVPRLLAHRARWVLSWLPPTDAELTFLAIGELPSDTELS